MLKKFFHSCLNTDSYDKRTFENLHKISPKLQNIEAEGEKVFPGFMNLAGDMWSSLYKANPQIDPEAGGKSLNHKPLVQRIMNSEEYDNLRQSTQLDDFASAIGSISLGENTIQYIRQKMEQDEQIKQQMEQMKNQQQEQQQNQQNMDKREAQGKKPTKKQDQRKESLEEQLQQMQQQINQQLADGMDAGKMLQEAGQEAKDSQDNLEDLMAGSKPGSGKGELEKVPLRTQLELAHMLKKRPEIKKVAEWAGRFKAIARKKQKSKVVDSVERQGIVQGDNPELLLPTELALLKNPATKLDFYRRFSEKETLQYATQGKESTGKGPVIICLDQSGSMNRRKEQAAGFALAIAMIARAQKRDFAYIPFESCVGETLYFPKGKMDSNSIVKIATEFMSGGTNFEYPLIKAMDIIETKSRFKQADIVFVTDGADSISSNFENEYKKAKDKHKFQCMSCVIGRLDDHTREELKKFSDEIFVANELVVMAQESQVFAI